VRRILTPSKRLIGLVAGGSSPAVRLRARPKKVSGTYNALYILRGALYMFQKQSFIYLVAMLYIEEKYE